jgi:hypothetical protein
MVITHKGQKLYGTQKMLIEFGYNNAYVSRSHPQMGCRFITQKIQVQYRSFSFFTK